MSAVRVPLRPPSAPDDSAARARRLRVVGVQGLDDAELVSLVLGTGTRGVAHAREAIADAGGLRAMANLEPESLSVAIGAERATGLAAAFELGRRAAACPAAPPWQVRSPADVGERLAPAMAHLEREELRVLLLNTKNVVTWTGTVYIGNLAGSSVRVGEVFCDAVRRLAAAIVVVHNHPSGDPQPSADDLRITGELAEAGRLLDIELLDHVVVAGNRWLSLRAIGVIQAPSRQPTRTR